MKYSTPGDAFRFGQELGIDTNPDVEKARKLAKPGWASGVFAGVVLGEDDHAFIPMNSGANYDFAQIDYHFDFDGMRIVASRMIAKIFAGHRTELAYWTAAAQPQELNVSQGRGSLVIGHPDIGNVEIYRLDASVTPVVTLQPGQFYTFKAARGTTEPLVVSGFYEGTVNWEVLEVDMRPGQAVIEAPEGSVPVPPQFAAIR